MPRSEIDPRQIVSFLPQEVDQLWTGLRAAVSDDLNARSPDELVDLAAGLTAALTAEAMRALHRFRSAPVDDVLLLRNLLPADAQFGPTAAHSSAGLGTPDTQAAALLLLAIALMLGEPFTFRTFCRGRLVQHVVPVPTKEHTQTGESSGGHLEWHVEDGFSDDRCDYFGLLCLQEDPGAVTEFAAARDVRLPERTRAVLREPRFRMLPDTGHVLDKVVPLTTAVLDGDDQNPQINFDAHYLSADPDDIQGARALAALRDALAVARRGHVLRRGELMLLDNRRLVHGRSPFTPRYDGVDRWLLRTMICSSLPRYRARGTRTIS